MGAAKGETSDGLKFCPCCGSERVYRHRMVSNNRSRIYCFDCGIGTPYFLDIKDAEKVWNRRTTEQDAADAWNERTMPLTMPPHVISEIEKTAKAINDCVEVCDMCVAYGKCGLIGIDHEAYQCRTAIAKALARAAGWSV